jgi:putative transposase
VLGLDRQRAWRWHTRRQAGLPLDDAPSGGNPIHGLLDWEQAEILAIFAERADVDRSHRKLAHRGSYEGRVWVSPSTVDRVLARHNLHLTGQTRPPKTVKKPWPAWTEWRPNQLWCWDGSQFESHAAPADEANSPAARPTSGAQRGDAISQPRSDEPLATPAT